MKRHWMAIAIVTGALIITAAFTVGVLILGPKFGLPDLLMPAVKPKPVKHYSLLTGKEVANEAAIKQPVTAVMIENSPDARPQSGLKQAGVVYEAVAEGGITRFLAVYQQEKPQLIGPVRSLRLYYLDYAAPYQASIAHVGGSPNALTEVRNGNYRDIDQFFNGGSYWRARDRYAPHNMYTNFEKLDALNTAKGYTSSQFTSFARADGVPAEAPNATAITVNFSSPLYSTQYTYDKVSNTYIRSMAGAPHRDREAGQITPDVVVVLKVGTQSRGGADAYEDLVTTGSGTAYVFQNGTVQEVTWKKAGRTAALELHDSAGKPVALNRGQTWVAAITGRGGVAWQ